MRVVALIACSLLAGCSMIDPPGVARRRNGAIECSDYRLPTVDTVFAAGALAGGTYAAIDSRQNWKVGVFGPSDAEMELYFVAMPLFALGTLTTISASIGYAMVSSCKRERRWQRERTDHTERVELQRKLQQSQAWSETKTAAQAARTGDCATVAKLDGIVRSLDAAFHATVFMNDAAIARCLGQ